MVSEAPEWFEVSRHEVFCDRLRPQRRPRWPSRRCARRPAHQRPHPVDVGGTYRLVNRYAFLQALDLTARIQNLLNEGYAEVRGFPALGINALVGLKASF